MIIIARMLRKVKIENSGDTKLLSGLVVDRFEFRKVNEDLAKCVKISPTRETAISNSARSCPRKLGAGERPD